MALLKVAVQVDDYDIGSSSWYSLSMKMCVSHLVSRRDSLLEVKSFLLATFTVMFLP